MCVYIYCTLCCLFAGRSRSDAALPTAPTTSAAATSTSSLVPKDLFSATAPAAPPAVVSRPTLGTATLPRPASELAQAPLAAAAAGGASGGAAPLFRPRTKPLPAQPAATPATFTIQRDANRWQQLGRPEVCRVLLWLLVCIPCD